MFAEDALRRDRGIGMATVARSDDGQARAADAPPRWGEPVPRIHVDVETLSAGAEEMSELQRGVRSPPMSDAWPIWAPIRAFLNGNAEGSLIRRVLARVRGTHLLAQFQAFTNLVAQWMILIHRREHARLPIVEHRLAYGLERNIGHVIVATKRDRQ